MEKRKISNEKWERNKKDLGRGALGYWFLKGQPIFYIQDFLDKRVKKYPPKFRADVDMYWLEYLRRHSELFWDFIDEYNLHQDFKWFCEQHFIKDKKS